MSQPNGNVPNGFGAQSQGGNMNNNNNSMPNDYQNNNAGGSNNHVRPTATTTTTSFISVQPIILGTAANLQQVPTNDPDVLFRGAFGTAVPQFSVTVNRTNITPEGNVAGEPVFNFNNLPPFLRDMVENAIRLGGSAFNGPSSKKHATEDAIKHLEIINPEDLEENESCCAICYEPFDNPIMDSGFESRNIATRREVASRQRFMAIDGDPGIVIPRDATARSHSELNFVYKDDKKTQKTETIVQPEHIPVRMPCKHIFGRSCLVEWLHSNVSCPLCRREVEAEEPAETTSGNISRERLLNTRSQSLIMNRAFCPADWASKELTNEDPAIPYPLATNSRRSGRGALHGRTVIHFADSPV